MDDFYKELLIITIGVGMLIFTIISNPTTEIDSQNPQFEIEAHQAFCQKNLNHEVTWQSLSYIVAGECRTCVNGTSVVVTIKPCGDLK